MPETIKFDDDYVMVTTLENSPGSVILYFSSAEWAFRFLLNRSASEDHLCKITRLGRLYDRRAIYEAAVAEGMEPDPEKRAPFDFDAAMKARVVRSLKNE